MGGKNTKNSTTGEQVRAIMVGLDAVGKTTILYRLNKGKYECKVPQIGFNIDIVEYKNFRITAWDVGGADRLRDIWKDYYKDINAFIFVIDSGDTKRFAEAKEELSYFLEQAELQTIPFLIIANKEDLPNTMSVNEISESLGLYQITNRLWYIQSCCATTKQGLRYALEWLSFAVSHSCQHLNSNSTCAS